MYVRNLERPRGAHFKLVRDTFLTVVKFPGPSLSANELIANRYVSARRFTPPHRRSYFPSWRLLFFALASTHLWASHVRRAWKIRWRFGAFGSESNASRKTRDIPVFPSFKCILALWMIQAAIFYWLLNIFSTNIFARAQYFVNLVIFQFYANVVYFIIRFARSMVFVMYNRVSIARTYWFYDYVLWQVRLKKKIE